MQFLPLIAAGGGTPPDFLESIAGGLCAYYVCLAIMNFVAALHVWHKLHKVQLAIVWTCVGMGFLILAALANSANPTWTPSLPQELRDWADTMLGGSMGATIYFGGTVVVLWIMFVYRAWFAKPVVAWSFWNLSLLALGLAVTDYDFFLIVGKPDNVPIVAMLFLIAFFTWLATNKAVENDRRLKEGLGPAEKDDADKVLVWPDLVYTELICMIALTALLLIWAIVLQAPLEEPASSVKTPNPSKAPWYFLGLQEMLVYYDPWMAGVVLPSLIAGGLMAMPYIDFNKAGNGYYTIDERKFAYLTFQFGFLVLWIPMIILGTFMRGPNWNIYGMFEFWDPHKLEALNNVNLSEYFWISGLGQGLPKYGPDASTLNKLGWVIWRELPGIILVLGYFILLPPLMAVTVFRGMFLKMGFIRFMVMANLLLFMAALPIKMVLRWTFNLKYLIAIPEYFLNF
ncbi:MAG: hypothetical protein MI757_11935 [Pirellulales bacterium]|nr:hypothetical protein [Pirellulales bacterium]